MLSDRGSNRICIKSKEPHVALATKGCVEFESNPDTLDLNKNNLHVSLKAVKYKLAGKIITNSKIPDLKLTVKTDSRKMEVPTTFNGKDGYTYRLMAFPSEEVFFQPQSSEFLFDPESLHVFVDHECHEDVVPFVAKKGQFVQGKITPPVEGVDIKIVNAGANLKPGMTVVTTDKNGLYKLGPLPEADYQVEASKDGYVFEASSDGFRSRKLASITVKVMDLDNNLLTGVVVSVSGGDYRSNTHSKDGIAEFLSLAPAEYFVKPQLKEYEFEPRHQLLNLGEGQNAEVVAKAKRVAFSIFGRVVSLNGEPEGGIALKAKSIKDGDIHTEDALTEPDGTFRFRGLKPQHEYTITHVKTSKEIENLMPSEIKVAMVETDHKLKKPIVTRRSFESMDIMLKVTDEKKPNSLNNKRTQIKISMNESPAGGYKYSSKGLLNDLIPLPSVPKDDKEYSINVETIPDKFALKKRVHAKIKADQYFR